MTSDDLPHQVIDEAHRLKNKDSLMAADLRTLRTKRTVMLTGTPLQNSTTERAFLRMQVLTMAPAPRSPQARRGGGGPASGEGQRRSSGRCGASAKRKRPPQRDTDGDQEGEMDRAVGRYLLYAGGMRALKPPFVCCWFDSCLWLQVRGGRSEHLRCQHSHPPTLAAVGHGSERAYPMVGGEWHPAAQ